MYVGVTVEAVRFVGALGTEAVVIEFVGGDSAEVPIEFVDVMVNVYEVLAARPLIVIGDVVPVTVILLGLLVTV